MHIGDVKKCANPKISEDLKSLRKSTKSYIKEIKFLIKRIKEVKEEFPQ